MLLSTGESFDVVRFGRLSAPDFYALRTPEHGLTFLSDLVSVKWTADGISVTERDGEQYTEAGKGLTPGNTLVRLLPTDDNQLQAVALSLDEPFRFVYGPKSSRARPRAADDRILQINVAAKPSKYRSGSIDTHFDKKERDAFRKALVADARKAATTIGKKSNTVDLGDSKIRAEVDQIGRTGACARTQSEDRLLAGDIAYTQYLVCAEYRQEAETLKSNGGELSPDKTPLLFLGRAARASLVRLQRRAALILRATLPCAH